MCRVKTERSDEEWEQLKAATPPGASEERRRSCPAFHKVWVMLRGEAFQIHLVKSNLKKKKARPEVSWTAKREKTEDEW